ncbi:hypothetical protein [Photobacterium galatheae]|uniref:Uncharacterized protein n=1 Tax=Photobacterium galatheae TaxID=1654360 RepID=A0A066RSM3_9GAMM|nr:hypothetical protein [Photobacterium galatheae]KDM93349.1 hypothetical protein EA58_01695 [Photobacterium galatheae]MCM0150472.1 hypothetical protein [Photobacterium galatheae]
MKTSVSLLIVTTIFLWFGIKEDPEFFSYAPFIKTRPCPKFIFYSPVGMQDPEDVHLTEKEKYEEFMFEQYFSVNGIQANGFRLSFCDMSLPEHA